MLKTICYLSTKAYDLSEEDITAIFEDSLGNNTAQDVTGILVYNQGNFLQVLEGEEGVVDTLFHKITKDERHKNIITVINSPLEDRLFSEFNLGYSVLTNVDDFKDLKLYTEALRLSEDAKAKQLYNIIDNFIYVYYNL